MPGVTMQWFGTDSLVRRILKAAAEAPILLGSALYVEGQRIMARAIPITPIEFGTLRASGHVDPPHITPSGAEVVLGFGGAAADYAVYVHEDMTARHAPPTQAKFLEQPVLEATRGIASRLGLSLKLRI